MRMKPCVEWWDEDEWHENEALHLIMMMLKHCTKKQQSNLFTKKNKKIKTSIFFSSHLSSLDLVHVTFPEMEIKKLEQFFNY